MPLPIELEAEGNNSQQQELQNLDAPQTDSPNEMLEKIQENPTVANNLGKLEIGGTEINLALVEEVLSVLRDIENDFYDSVDGKRYINLEHDRVSYSWLRRAGETEAPRLIKNKRRIDLSLYGKQADKGAYGIERGAKLVFSNPEYSPTKEESILLREYEKVIFNKLFFPANEPKPNFAKFIATAYEDYFDLDDITVEIRRDRFGYPKAIHLQDPIIWKPVIKKRRYFEGLENPDLSELLKDYEKLYGMPEFYETPPENDVDYLLVYQNQKLAGATRDVIRKFHYFTRSDFQKAQRGYSIMEQAVRLTTYITNALKMNASNFSNNRLPQGFFAFTGGGVSQLQLEKLKKIFYAYQTGAWNQSRFPMISIKGEKGDVKWVGTRNNSRDMEYHQYMVLLFTILCQLSGTDPRELSLGSYGDAIGKRSLFEEPTDGIIKETKDMGLRTFLQHLEESLNENDNDGTNLFQKITKMDVKLKFVGFEIEDKKSKLEINTKELMTHKSVNDLLTENDQERQQLDFGGVNIYDVKAISNNQIWQALMFKAQQEAQQQQTQEQGGIEQMLGGQQQGEENEEPEPNEKDKEIMEKYGKGGQSEIEEAIRQELEGKENE